MSKIYKILGCMVGISASLAPFLLIEWARGAYEFDWYTLATVAFLGIAFEHFVGVESVEITGGGK